MLPDRLSRLLTGFVDGQLSALEQTQVAELLRRSAEARTLLQQLQADARSLGELPSFQLPPEFAEQLQARLPKRVLKIAEQPMPPGRRFTWRQTGIFAAAATLLLAMGITFLHTAERPVDPSDGDTGNSAVAQSDDEQKSTVLIAARPPSPTIPTPIKAPTGKLVAKGDGSLPETLGVMPREEAILTAPLPNTKPLRDIDLKAPLLLAMRDLDKDKNRQEITEELALAKSWRLDFTCQESELATNRLKRALQEQGIRLLIDPDASVRQKLRLARTPYAVLVENVSPQECLAMLSGLRQVDKEEQNRARGVNQFIDVKFGRTSEAETARMESMFGIKELKPAVTPITKLTAVELNRRDRDPTPQERALAIWRGQLPKPGQGIPRNAFLIADSPNRVRKASNESQLFLNSRQPPRPGTLQIVIYLVPRKG